MDGCPRECFATDVRIPRAMMRRLRPLLAAIGVTIVGGVAALTWPSSAAGLETCRSPEIRIYKREGALDLVCDGAVRRSMAATFGGNPSGPKEEEGDERTPEGVYRITFKVKNEHFHGFLGVSYPNDDDRRRAAEKGITRIGGDIGIHGTTSKQAAVARAWTRFASAAGIASVWGPTDGCIGVANEDSEALFDAVPVGTKVTIAPARPAPTVAPLAPSGGSG
jgi:murein L,D-transpeptidase YafK